MPETIAGIKIPDSRMAKDLTELTGHRVGALVLRHVICVLHASRTEFDRA